MDEGQFKQILEEIRNFIMNKRVGFICYIWSEDGELGGGCQSLNADAGDAMVTIERTLEHFKIDPIALHQALNNVKHKTDDNGD